MNSKGREILENLVKKAGNAVEENNYIELVNSFDQALKELYEALKEKAEIHGYYDRNYWAISLKRVAEILGIEEENNG